MVKLKKRVISKLENKEANKQTDDVYQNNTESKDDKLQGTPFDFLLKKHPKCKIIDNGDGTYGFIGI